MQYLLFAFYKTYYIMEAGFLNSIINFIIVISQPSQTGYFQFHMRSLLLLPSKMHLKILNDPDRIIITLRWLLRQINHCSSFIVFEKYSFGAHRNNFTNLIPSCWVLKASIPTLSSEPPFYFHFIIIDWTSVFHELQEFSNGDKG